MPISKAQQQATAKYVKSNYDRIEIKVKKGWKEAVEVVAEAKGESVNGYIKGAIKARIKADTGQDADL